MTNLFDGVLLASDFDGTLADSRGEITPDVRAAIRFFTQNGGVFTVCTGRTRLGFHAWSAELINAPVLLANGGMIYDYARESIFRFDGIGDEGLAPIRFIRDAFAGVSIELYPFEKSCVIRPTSLSRRHLGGQGMDFDEIDDPAQASRPWAKAMIGGTREEIAQIQTLLATNFPEVDFVPSDGVFLEILKKGVSKGEALLTLAEQLHVKREDVYAVGDGRNDAPMLSAAAKSFAPANAHEAAIRCADVIVPSNDAGALASVVGYLRRAYEARSNRCVSRRFPNV